MILNWGRDKPSCGLPRLDKFHRVGVRVDSCRQLSAYGQTQKCSCQEMISVQYVWFCSGGAQVVPELKYQTNAGGLTAQPILLP